MPADDVILARIRKLLAVAEHPSTPPAEAETAANAAERLILKHSIDEALLTAHSESRGRPEVRSMVIDAPYASAKTVLLGAVAAAHSVRVITHRGEQPARATMVGFSSDLQLVDLLYTSLLLQAARDLSRQPVTGRAFRRAFLIGFASEVGQRLQQLRAEVVEDAGGASTALALRDRDDEVAQAVREHFPRLATSRISISDQGGLVAGRRSGAAANLGSGANGLDGRRTAISG